MDKNEFKNKVNKRFNEGVDSVFDIFETLFDGFQSNFDKVFRTDGDDSPAPSTDNTTNVVEKKENKKNINTTEIHAFKEFKDGKCVNSEKKVWKNGKLVSSEGTSSATEDKCKCNKCECTNKDPEKAVDVTELMLKKISTLEAQVKKLTNENVTLKERLNKIKNCL